MNITTIKAKALLAASKLHLKMISKEEQAKIIEDVFVNTYTGYKPPIFAMAPFSGVVGCGIYRIDDPGKPIAIVPPQEAAERSITQPVNAVKLQTEHVARLILQALNAS